MRRIALGITYAHVYTFTSDVREGEGGWGWEREGRGRGRGRGTGRLQVYNSSCVSEFAALYIRMEVCSLLLSHGADPTIPNCHSKTALDLATSDQNRERLDCKYEG